MLRDEVAVGEHVDVGHDVDLEAALVGDLLQHCDRRGKRPPLLGRGVAEPGPQLGSGLREGTRPGLADVAHEPDDGGEERGLLEHAVGVLGGCVVAHHLERGRVERRQVARLVDDDDRYVAGHRVEVVARRVTELGELRVVVAEADDEVVRLHRLGIGGHPVAECLLQRGDVGDLTVRRRQHVGRQRLQPAHEHVAVGVDEARQQRAAGEVDDLGGRAPVGHHRVRRPDGHDAAVLLGHRLGAHGGVGHGQDRPAGPDPVGGLPRGGGGQAQQDGDCQQGLDSRHVGSPRTTD